MERNSRVQRTQRKERKYYLLAACNGVPLLNVARVAVKNLAKLNIYVRPLQHGRSSSRSKSLFFACLPACLQMGGKYTCGDGYTIIMLSSRVCGEQGIGFTNRQQL